MKDEIFLEWHSPEHHFDRKKNDWYWILGVIVLATAVLSFYFGNFLFGVFILIAGATLGIISYKETKIIPIKITAKGIIAGRYLHPWLSYRSFWIEDEHVSGARILLRPTSTYQPLTVIPINEEVDLSDIHDLLLEFLDEEFLRESAIHRLFDKILTRW